MALSTILGRRNNLWDVPDPFELLVTTSDNALASSYIKNAQAVASTNVDWKETPTKHVFKIDLPGLGKEDVVVTIEDGRTLTISGQRIREQVQKGDTWHRVERSTGAFMRKFRLPQTANLDRITATVENGVLTITVPKEEKEVDKTRSIEVGGHESGSQQQQQSITHGDNRSSESAAK